MPLDKSVQRRIRGLPDEKLLEMLEAPADYLPEALVYAHDVVTERGGEDEVRRRVAVTTEHEKREASRHRTTERQRIQQQETQGAAERQASRQRIALGLLITSIPLAIIFGFLCHRYHPSDQLAFWNPEEPVTLAHIYFPLTYLFGSIGLLFVSLLFKWLRFALFACIGTITGIIMLCRYLFLLMVV